jgi:hypothetical protein
MKICFPLFAFEDSHENVMINSHVSNKKLRAILRIDMTSETNFRNDINVLTIKCFRNFPLFVLVLLCKMYRARRLVRVSNEIRFQSP